MILCSVLCFGVYIKAQEIRQYADTFKLQDSVEQLTEDQLLLSLIHQQSEAIKAREDSLEQVRFATDTTTAFPFYVGYADSIRIARYVAEHYGENSLFLPIVYIPEDISFLTPRDTLFNIYRLRLDTRKDIVAHNTSLVRGTLNKEALQESLIEEFHGHEPLNIHITPIRSLLPDPEGDRRAIRNALREEQTHWKREGTLMLQLTQNYVSKNWYAGGNSNFAILGIAQGNVKYDDQKRVTWEANGEWRMGFNTVAGDSLRKINANEDIFKLYTKLGINIYKQLLAYSFSADFQTHFFNTWKDNTRELKTGPLTPIRLNIATGIDYKPVAGLSIYFAPLTYKLVYANDTVHSTPTAYSIKEGERILNDVGSSLRVEWQWQPVREIKLNSTLYLYTNYHRIELDWETSCDFIITRYFSARVMIHPRYDTTVILPDDEKARLQFKELISIGFAHNFK